MAAEWNKAEVFVVRSCVYQAPHSGWRWYPAPERVTCAYWLLQARCRRGIKNQHRVAGTLQRLEKLRTRTGLQPFDRARRSFHLRIPLQQALLLKVRRAEKSHELADYF